MSQEIGRELRDVDLGDKRLNERSRMVIEALAADPAASVNKACNGWSESIAAYRFFDNPKVEPDAILAAHRAAAQRRIAQEEVVLLVQDTTELDFSDHPPQDAGVLNAEDRFGLYDHSQLAFTPQGLCLGVWAADFYDRTPESLGQAELRKSLPIEEKETFRWLEGYREACRLQEEQPGTQIVSVADSEADIFEIFLERSQHAVPADFVIRAKQDRRSVERDPETGPNAYKSLRDEVTASTVVATREIDLPQTPKREARRARLEIRARTVQAKHPANRPELGVTQYNLIEVREVGRPADDKTAVHWLLITTLPIETPQQVLQAVDYYVGRWPIEIFFRVFKTGCKVEEIQLETQARLKRCLVFYKVIAWRILQVTYQGRVYPNLDCDQLFADCEWKSVWRVVTKKKLPKKAPPLSKFIPILAQLGGYNNRTQDAPPGPEVLWTAMRRMLDFATAWQTFGPRDDDDE